MQLVDVFNDALATLGILIVIVGSIYQLATRRVKGELHEKIKKLSLFQKALFYLTAILIVLFFISLIMAGTLTP